MSLAIPETQPKDVSRTYLVRTKPSCSSFRKLIKPKFLKTYKENYHGKEILRLLYISISTIKADNLLCMVQTHACDISGQ